MFFTKTLVTHSGSFHPDDIFAAATLRLLLGRRTKIIRTREEWRIKNGDYVFDVGGVYDPKLRRFDHHQQGGAGKRENGIPYASFGLVWKAYGVDVCGGNQQVATAIDNKLVQLVDAIDNGVEVSKPLIDGVYHFSLFDVMSAFAPTWNEKSKDLDECFFQAVLLAEKILFREIKRASDKALGESRVEEAYQKAEDKRIIVLDDNYSWGDVTAKYPEPLFVVSPVPQSSDWRVKAVRNSKYTFENRKSFPKNWAGLRGAELAQVSGVSDAVFCHNARFIAVAKSRDGALLLARKAVDAE